MEGVSAGRCGDLAILGIQNDLYACELVVFRRERKFCGHFFLHFTVFHGFRGERYLHVVQRGNHEDTTLDDVITVVIHNVVEKTAVDLARVLHNTVEGRRSGLAAKRTIINIAVISVGHGGILGKGAAVDVEMVVYRAAERAAVDDAPVKDVIHGALEGAAVNIGLVFQHGTGFKDAARNGAEGLEGAVGHIAVKTAALNTGLVYIFHITAENGLGSYVIVGILAIGDGAFIVHLPGKRTAGDGAARIVVHLTLEGAAGDGAMVAGITIVHRAVKRTACNDTVRVVHMTGLRKGTIVNGANGVVVVIRVVVHLPGKGTALNGAVIVHRYMKDAAALQGAVIAYGGVGVRRAVSAADQGGNLFHDHITHLDFRLVAQVNGAGNGQGHGERVEDPAGADHFLGAAIVAHGVTGIVVAFVLNFQRDALATQSQRVVRIEHIAGDGQRIGSGGQGCAVDHGDLGATGGFQRAAGAFAIRVSRVGQLLGTGGGIVAHRRIGPYVSKTADGKIFGFNGAQRCAVSHGITALGGSAVYKKRIFQQERCARVCFHRGFFAKIDSLASFQSACRAGDAAGKLEGVIDMGVGQGRVFIQDKGFVVMAAFQLHRAVDGHGVIEGAVSLNFSFAFHGDRAVEADIAHRRIRVGRFDRSLARNR